ncbi:inter-alpha-trypsin inhibitor heavy chain H3-like [Discoglossus pictus]
MRLSGFWMEPLHHIALLLILLAGSVIPADAQVGHDPVRVRSLHVDSLITSRFARNVITSRVSNEGNASREISFDVELPKSAFISNFSMTIDGKTYVGSVKEKKVAQKVYNEAVSRGQSAGIVKASGRLMEAFKVSVSVAPRSKVIFQLTYEELLKRRLGQYQMLLKIQPKQLVEDFQIEVLVNETQVIRFLEAGGTFLNNELNKMVDTSFSGNKGRVLFKPPLDAQRQCPDCGTTMLDGEFTIKYDVDRSRNVGDIQIVNGYFVHFFAPENLPQIPKRVVFVIDVSGSMYGRKILQTREALMRIADDLHPEDYFDLVIFSSGITQWKGSVVKASPATVNMAKSYISNLEASGGTNINDALLAAVRSLLQSRPNEEATGTGAPMIILLTDGEPTVGVTNPAQIQANVKAAISGQLSLYCLGFGHSVDYNLLQTLSLENGGIARRIYEDSDADLQLQGFYNEVAQPLLTGVQVRYPENTVSNLTRNTFDLYYGGSEIVVAGKISNNDLTDLPSEVKAQGTQDRLTFNTSGRVTEEQGYIFGEYTERLWAYLTIQQILEEQILAKGEDKERLKAQALALSLRYNFVTPFTSMVVTKPDKHGEDTPTVAEKSAEGAAGQQSLPPSSPGRQNSRLLKSGVISAPQKLVQQQLPSQSFVDGDPHFMVRLPGGNETFCFNVMKKPGVFLSLVEDPVTGITINGELIGKNKDGTTDHAGSTYIGRLGLRSHKMGVQVEVTTEIISVISEGRKSILTWNEKRTQIQNGLTLNVLDEGRLRVTIDEITFLIIRHQPLKKSKLTDYLGLYTEDNHRLSKSTSGILGQLYQQLPLEIDVLETKTPQAMLYFRGIKMKVFRHQYRDFHERSVQGVPTLCWFVPDDRMWLMDRPEEHFLVSGLFESPSDTWSSIPLVLE